MITKKKYPKIEPQFEENDKGKKIRVILNYDVYKSIFERIENLQKSLKKIGFVNKVKNVSKKDQLPLKKRLKL